MTEIYFLVEWVGEDKFSAVSVHQIVDGTLRKESPENLLGKEVSFFWNRKRYSGFIHQYGAKIDIDNDVKLYAEEKAAKASESFVCEPVDSNSAKDNVRNNKNVNSFEAISSVMQQVNSQSLQVENLTAGLNDFPNEDLSELQKARLKIKKYKKLAKERKRVIDELKAKQTETNVNKVCIGNGLYVAQSDIATIRTLSDNPNVYARNMMRVLFTEDEMLGKSMFGKRCSANIATNERPELDPARRDAIILHTMNIFGHEVNSVKQRKNCTLKDMKRSMGDFLRELEAKKRKTW